MPMHRKKAKVLRGKNIKRKTGAKSQGKQILALSKAVTKINKEQLENIRTSWQRENLPIGHTVSTTTPYICPIPYVMCDPTGTSPVTGAGHWTDNVASTSQPTFAKRMVFGYSDAAENSNKIYHTGGILRYQVWTNEPSFTKLGMYLIRAKKNVADQLVVDRKMKATAVLGGPGGSLSTLSQDIDFTCHDGAGPVGNMNTFYGSEINRKYWTVLHKREITLTHPLASGFANNASANNDSPANNALTASGIIKLPAGGIIRNVSTQTSTVAPKSASAFETQYLDQSNENACYLVIIHNDVTVDVETVDVGFVVTDYYKAVV